MGDFQSNGGPMHIRYEDVYRQSLADPERLWSEAAEAVDWAA
jgi:hypothetical protein